MQLLSGSPGSTNVLLLTSNRGVNKMKNVQLAVYKYSELSDAAKEKARAWYASGDNFYDEGVIDNFTTIAGMMGNFKPQQRSY
jgi:hypothetical protein